LMQSYIDGSYGSLSSAANVYWSATTTSGGTHVGWYVGQDTGNTNYNAKTSTTMVRCVR